MKKISKVIFVHEDEIAPVIENIKTVVGQPKIVGRVELPSYKKWNKSNSDSNQIGMHGDKQAGMTPKFWCNFPISMWDLYIEAAKTANHKIDAKGGGKMSITLSKKAFNEQGELDDKQASIWFTCGSKDFRDFFRKPLLLKISEIGLRRITKKELFKLDSHTEFCLIYLTDRCDVDILTCLKTEDQGDGKCVVYTVNGDGGKNIHRFAYLYIDDNGNGRFDDNEEDFYFYVSSRVENI